MIYVLIENCEVFSAPAHRIEFFEAPPPLVGRKLKSFYFSGKIIVSWIHQPAAPPHGAGHAGEIEAEKVEKKSSEMRKSIWRKFFFRKQVKLCETLWNSHPTIPGAMRTKPAMHSSRKILCPTEYEVRLATKIKNYWFSVVRISRDKIKYKERRTKKQNLSIPA